MSSTSTDVPGQLINSGIAGKKVQATGGWKKRKLVLTDQVFAWFKTHHDNREEGRFPVQSNTGEPLLSVRDVSIETQEPNTFCVAYNDEVHVFQTATAADFFDWVIALQQYSTTQVNISYDNKLDVTDRKKKQLLSSKAPPPKPPVKPAPKTQKISRPDSPPLPQTMINTQSGLELKSPRDDRPFAEQLPTVLKLAHDYSLLLEPNLPVIQQHLSQEAPDHKRALSVIVEAAKGNSELTKYLQEQESKIIATVLTEYGTGSPAILLTQLTLHFLLYDYTHFGPPRRPQKPPPTNLPLGFAVETTPVMIVTEEPSRKVSFTQPKKVEEVPKVVEKPKAPPRTEKPALRTKSTATPPPTNNDSNNNLSVDFDAVTANRRRLSVITKVKSARLSVPVDIPSEQPVISVTADSSAPRVARAPSKRPAKRPPSRRNNSDLLSQVEKKAAEESLTTIKDVEPSKEPEPEPEPDKDRILQRITGNKGVPMMGMPMMGMGMGVALRASLKSRDEVKPINPPDSRPNEPDVPPRVPLKPPTKPIRPPPKQELVEEVPVEPPLETVATEERSETPTSAKKVFGVPGPTTGVDFQSALAAKLSQGGGLKRMSIDERRPSTPSEENQSPVDFRAGLKKTGSFAKPPQQQEESNESESRLPVKKAPPPSVPTKPDQSVSEDTPQTDFRSALKKGPPPTVPTKPDTSSSPSDESQPTDFRTQLKKGPPPTVPTVKPSVVEEAPQTDFRTQLKKGPPSIPVKPVQEISTPTEEPQQSDFRSALKKSPPSVPTKPNQSTSPTSPDESSSPPIKKGPPPSVPSKPTEEPQQVDFRSALKKSPPPSVPSKPDTKVASPDDLETKPAKKAPPSIPTKSDVGTVEEVSSPATPQSSSSFKKGPPPTIPVQPGDILKQLKKRESSADLTDTPDESEETPQQDFRTLLKKPTTAPPPKPKEEPAAQQVDFRSLLKKRGD